MGEFVETPIDMITTYPAMKHFKLRLWLSKSLRSVDQSARFKYLMKYVLRFHF